MAWLTVGSGVAFGMNFVILDQVPVEAQLWPLVFGRLAATAIVLLAAVVTADLVLERGVPLRLALFAAVLDTVANVATLLALQSSMLSLAGNWHGAGPGICWNDRCRVATVKVRPE